MEAVARRSSRALLRRTWFDMAMAAVVILVFGGPVVLGVIGRHQHPDESTYEGRTAWAACREAVRGHLKAPATARFTGPTLSPGVGPDETQIIAAAVDAQRSDGVVRRTEFVCEATLMGTDWMAYVKFVK